MRWKVPVVLGLLGALVWAMASPAAAQADTDLRDIVVLTGKAEVATDETAETVVVFDGPIVIEGEVMGPVVSFNGPVTIRGRVEEEVISFNGLVTVESGAEIGGDLITRTAPVVEDGATVQGEVRREAFDVLRGPFVFLAKFVLWLAISASLLLLGILLILFAPRAAAAVASAWSNQMGGSIGWGVLLLVGLPLLGVFALVTLVGIPFGLGLLSALGLIYAVGYVASALILGRQIVKPPGSMIVAFLVGFLILRVVALVPILAGLVGALAAAFGLGAIAVAAWRAREPAPAA